MLEQWVLKSFYLEEQQLCFSCLTAGGELLSDGTSTHTTNRGPHQSVVSFFISQNPPLISSSNMIFLIPLCTTLALKQFCSTPALRHRTSITCGIYRGSQSLLASSKIPSSCQPYSNAVSLGRKTNQPTSHLTPLGKRTPRAVSASWYFPPTHLGSQLNGNPGVFPGKGRLSIKIYKMTQKKKKRKQEFQCHPTSILETSTLLHLPELKRGLLYQPPAAVNYLQALEKHLVTARDHTVVLAKLFPEITIAKRWKKETNLTNCKLD